MSHVIAATAETLNAEIAEGVVLVDFYADWCGPCQQTLPELVKVAEAYAGRAKVVKVDVDALPDVAAQHQVRSLPTIKVFKDGLVADTVIGAHTQQALGGLIDAQLGG